MVHTGQLVQWETKPTGRRRWNTPQASAFASCFSIQDRSLGSVKNVTNGTVSKAPIETLCRY